MSNNKIEATYDDYRTRQTIFKAFNSFLEFKKFTKSNPHFRLKTCSGLRIEEINELLFQSSWSKQ